MAICKCVKCGEKDVSDKTWKLHQKSFPSRDFKLKEFLDKDEDDLASQDSFINLVAT